MTSDGGGGRLAEWSTGNRGEVHSNQQQAADRADGRGEGHGAAERIAAEPGAAERAAGRSGGPSRRDGRPGEGRIAGNPGAAGFPAPGGALRLQHLSVEEGLSNAFVWKILQDRQGLLWIATEDGLNRYDGCQFTIFRHDGPGSLSHNTVWALCEDRVGTLWVGTYGGGLDRFDRATQTFAHFRHDPRRPDSLSDDHVRAILESPDEPGILWVATYGGGLNRFDTARGTFTRFRHAAGDPGSLADDLVWSMAGDRAGTLWLGTVNGLSRLDRAERLRAGAGGGARFATYRHEPGNPRSLSHDYVTSIYEDRAGTLWAGTDDGGLNRFDRAAGTFAAFQNRPGDPASVSHNSIRPIYEDRAGTLWVGTYGGGLNRFDRAAGAFARYRNDPGDPRSLSNNILRDICEDRSGVLWIATWGGGLNKLVRPKFFCYRHEPGNPQSLPHNFVTAVCEDRAGALWVGTQAGGLTRIRRTASGTEAFETFRHQAGNPRSLSDDYVTALHEAPDEPGVLWIGTFDQGLNRLDTRTGAFTRYRRDPADSGSLTSDRILSLCASPSQPHVLWVGTDGGGLDRFDRATGRAAYIAYNHGQRDNPKHASIRAVAESPGSGVLWVGTDGEGLYKLAVGGKAAARPVAAYRHGADDPGSLVSDRVHCIRPAADGALWIGTFEGLSRLDPHTGRCTFYREREGLPNNVIYGLAEDRSGRLWISTDRGLSRFDPAARRFKNYDVSDGLQSHQFFFEAVFRSPGGRLYFGGINGLNAFDPDAVRDNPHVPPVVITDFQVFNESVPLAPARTRGGYSLPRPIGETDSIRLSHKESVFSFEFAALDYTAPEKNQYAYKMDGFDEDWTWSGRRRFATYTNLDPGRYVFRVKGSNSDGVWNERSAAVRLDIAPPLWRTWWAYLSYLALAVLLVFGCIDLRTRHLRRTRQVLETVVRERTAEIQKAQEQLIVQDKLASLGTLTAGIAHEIKNPLNFITNFSRLSIELLQELREGLARLGQQADAGAAADLREVLQLLEGNIAKIDEHGRRADSIVKGMLLHSRNEAGERRPVDINAVLDEYVGLAYHGMRGIDSTFNLRIEKEYDPAVGRIDGVEQDLSRVFLNLIHNACYATHEKKKREGDRYAPVLSVRTRRLADGIEIRIRDNGPGIAPPDRPRIFHPFFTTKPSGEGTGLGLAISYDIIVQEHGGEIRVETEEGEFAEFIIRLPLNGKPEGGR